MRKSICEEKEAVDTGDGESYNSFSAFNLTTDTPPPTPSPPPLFLS